MQIEVWNQQNSNDISNIVAYRKLFSIHLFNKDDYRTCIIIILFKTYSKFGAWSDHLTLTGTSFRGTFLTIVRVPDSSVSISLYVIPSGNLQSKK